MKLRVYKCNESLSIELNGDPIPQVGNYFCVRGKSMHPAENFLTLYGKVKGVSYDYNNLHDNERDVSITLED